MCFRVMDCAMLSTTDITNPPPNCRIPSSIVLMYSTMLSTISTTNSPPIFWLNDSKLLVLRLGWKGMSNCWSACMEPSIHKVSSNAIPYHARIRRHLKGLKTGKEESREENEDHSIGARRCYFGPRHASAWEPRQIQSRSPPTPDPAPADSRPGARRRVRSSPGIYFLFCYFRVLF